MSEDTNALSRFVVAPVKWVALFIRGLMRPVWWTLPMVAAAVSFFIPLLNTPVSAGVPDDKLWLFMIGQVVVVIVFWLVANIVIVNNKDTTTTELQYDHSVSCSVTGAMLVFFGALVVGFDAFGMRFELTWGYLTPLLAAVLDMYLTGHVGLNNAAQKPFLDRDKP